MRLILIADSFPPHINSAAVQLSDLASEFIRQGYEITVVIPSPGQKSPWTLEVHNGVRILRFKSGPIKSKNYIRRTLAEIFMPFWMARNLKKSPLAKCVWNGIIWYSPSIFHGPFVSKIKKKHKCKTYLIIRDIFPNWALEMGLMNRSPIYYFFKAVACYQYSVANVIGVESPGNLIYFRNWKQYGKKKIEVLHNWLGKPGNKPSSIQIQNSVLSGRKIFIYAGNMGSAQNLDIFINLAENLKQRDNLGFLFVGNGSESHRLQASVRSRCLNNVLFHDFVHPDQIPNLYSQCYAGLLSLDPRISSHNIPGKFLSYVQNGLPVLANLNKGNDLTNTIVNEKIGYVCETNNVNELSYLLEKLIKFKESNKNQLIDCCKNVFIKYFTVEKAVKQIASNFNE